jgi:CRP-like cAMP-binding protein
MAIHQNRLLAVIPPEIHERLRPFMKTVDLPHGQVIHRPGQLIEVVYFPITCLISITVTMVDGNTTDAGIAGSREMVGINAFMGGSETNQTEYVAQVEGTAVRIPAEPLLAEFDCNKSFRGLLLRYTQAYIAQLSQNVACNRQHDVNQRVARWLLESCDRLQSDHVPLTHEFIGEMLGVRRAGVSEALALIQDSGLIKSGRKSITILNMQGLNAASCECFAVIRDEYDRLLGKRPSAAEA